MKLMFWFLLSMTFFLTIPFLGLAAVTCLVKGDFLWSFVLVWLAMVAFVIGFGIFHGCKQHIEQEEKKGQS